MPTPSNFDLHVNQPPSSRRSHVWTLPPATKGWAGRWWDKFTEQVASWCGPQRLVVEPPDWFVRAQADSRRDIPVGPTPKSDVRRAQAHPHPSHPSVHLPG